MSNLPALLAAALLLSASALAGAPQGEPIALTGQKRWVSASASSDGKWGSSWESEFASAEDFTPFRDLLVASAGGVVGSAWQSSHFRRDGVFAAGGVHSEAFDFGMASGGAGSSLKLRFALTTRATWSARGALRAAEFLGGSGATSSRVELARADRTPVFAFEASAAHGDVQIDAVGLLEPGEYVLSASAGAGGQGQIWSSAASFLLAFDLEPVGRGAGESVGTARQGRARFPGIPVGAARSPRE